MNKHDELPCSSGSITLPQRMFAAFSGAVVTSLTMTPMDVVKIRLQQQAHPFVKGTCFLYHNGLMDHLCTACADTTGKQPCEWFLRPGNFTGTLDAFLKISRTEGVTSLWSGLSPTLVMAVPATVFYYAVYDNLLLSLRKNEGNSWWLPMFAGAAARTLASSFVSPLEMIRTKMQSERLTYYEIGEAIRRTKAVDGWFSLWRGWVPTLMRDLPFSAVYWTTYEFLKFKAMSELRKSEMTFSTSFLCGAVSGSIAAFVTTPFDVAKTHRQITLGETSEKHSGVKVSKKVQSETTFGILRELLQKNGVRALFTGVVPRVVKISPACAIMIGLYEHAKTYFAKSNQHKNEKFGLSMRLSEQNMRLG